jgi:hypothetical protein
VTSIAQLWVWLSAVLVAICFRAEPEKEPVAAKFGYPLGTVWHQIMVGPQAYDRATSIGTSQYIYVLRYCLETRCRDFLMLHVRTNDRTGRRRERYFNVKELEALHATVTSMKLVPSETANRYEVVAATSAGPVTVCIWPKAFDGYQAYALARAAGEPPSCPEAGP